MGKDEEIKLGKPIGKYTVVRQIGRGATSSVYEVKDKTSNERYALKFLAPYNGKDIKLMEELFLSEARCLQDAADYADEEFRIIKVQDICAEHPCYYVMDLVRASDGNIWTLSDIQNNTHDVRHKLGISYTEETLIRWFLDLAKSLVYLHGARILHCDIKPSNILVDKDNHAVLVDYGASRYFSSKCQEQLRIDAIWQKSPLRKCILGTPGYKAPEVIDVEETNKGVSSVRRYPLFTPALDVYSLGATFWQLLFNEHIGLQDEASRLIRDAGHSYLIDDKRWIMMLPRMLKRSPADRISIEKCVAILSSNPEKTKARKEEEHRMIRKPTIAESDKQIYDSAYYDLIVNVQKYVDLLQQLKWEHNGKVYEQEFVIRAIYDLYRKPELKELKAIYCSKDRSLVNKARENLEAQDDAFMTDFVDAGLQPLADVLFFKLNAIWASVVNNDDHSYSELAKVCIEQRVAKIRCYMSYEAQFVFGKYRHIRWKLDSDRYFTRRKPSIEYRGERAADRLFVYERTIAAYNPQKDVAEMQITTLANRNKIEGLRQSDTLDMREIWGLNK